MVALIVLVTGVTGALLGGLAWVEKRSGARALTRTAMVQVANLTAEHAERFFSEAEPAVRLGPSLVDQRMLDPADSNALEHYLLAMLRAHPELTWASYGDRDDRFVGAWRDEAGDVYVNRSFPRNGRIRLEEERLLAGGRRITVRTSDDHGYHPKDRPYFKLAEAMRGVAWTEPYPFYGVGMGITCVAPLLDAAGAVRGVFTIDFSLERLSGFLDGLRVTPRSRVYITTAEGKIIVAPGSVEDAQQAADARAMAEVVRTLDDPRRPPTVDGYRVLTRAGKFTVGQREWRVAVLVPESDFMAAIDAQGRQAALLGAVALMVAAGAGIALSRWISRPLRALGAQARRISVGDLDVSIVPDSRDEIGTLAQTMADMVKGLRDRDFIRDVLGRYVNPELAEQCLRDREAVRLGGELRTVSILMSDLRGFSAMSERLGPQAMIGLLNRYLAQMVPVILGHHGTINEFIGDAILVLFGAPVERPDDAERAVRCAWAMQRAMADFNTANLTAGLPELTMGIGLHTGRVVAGNIGSPDRVKYGVVGPAVNIAGRIESLTVGPQILISQEVFDRVKQIARVGPSRETAMKGIGEAIIVYELQGVAGEEDWRARSAAVAADVDLPAACYRLEGKRVIEPPYRARVTRLGLQDVQFEADPRLPDDVLDVKLLIDFGDGRAGAGSYARIAARHPVTPAGVTLVAAVFTALDEADREKIARTIPA
jgi:class 3 adenylate cyclase